jgi:predicted nucleic acid-binding protein
VAVQLGWLDTNVFIHALHPNDREYVRSRAILDALADGRAEGWLSPLVAHELTYALRRFPAYQTRTAIQTYLLAIASNSNIQVEDKPTLIAAVTRWATSASIAFVDAYLTELAQRDAIPVCPANARFPHNA